MGADHREHRARPQPAAADGNRDDVEVLIGQMVHVIPQGQAVQRSSASGTAVTMDDLVDVVGADAARYTLIRSAVEAPLGVDLDLISRRSSDNPVFSVQYAHARLSSLRRNAESLGMGALDGADLSLLTHEREGELIRTLADYPRVVRTSARLRQPYRVARYVEELASAYHRFYDVYPVLQPGDDQVSPPTVARLQLCAATRQVLANSLGLLGVSAPEQM